MNFLYDMILIIFLIFSLPAILFQLIVKGKYRKSFKMRLGFLPAELSARLESLKGKKVIWLHAVSVGEMIAASALLPRIREEFPGYKLVISTTTETGQGIARKKVKEDEVLIYSPLDLSFIVSCFIKKVSPAVFIVMETEIWPNIIRQMAACGAKTFLINGRISPRSYHGYRRIKWLLAPVLKQMSLLCMQTPRDAGRILALGADPAKVKVTGNIKFDQALVSEPTKEQLHAIREKLMIKEDNKLLVAGSTHPGEEKILLEVYNNLRGQFPELKLLIAPRHIERTPEIERMAVRLGLVTVRYTDMLETQMSKESYVIILDTIGVLREIYCLASLVFVGGSLARHGGHNMLEPAALARPIIFGPHVYNFQDIADLFLAAHSEIMVHDKMELEQACRWLFSSDKHREALGHRAKLVVEQNTGAVERNIAVMKKIINNEAP